MNLPWRGLIREYKEYLPVSEDTPVVTLNEGNTPLIRCYHLTRHLRLPVELYLKFEGANPTGSFKDRGMTMAISKAVEAGSQAVICASTGNTSASAAAYGARAGIKVYVLIPEGKIALGKLVQAMIHRATVVQVKGNFDEALTIVKRISEKFSITLVNSINPYRLEGQKTAAFEVCDQMRDAPTHHFLPVGNAGNIAAYWRGYQEYYAKGKIVRLPKMMGFQAAGAAPIVLGHVVEKPKTIATAIRIGNPASWKPAVQAVEESKGAMNLVTDEEIVEAYRLIAWKEGVFCEPSSAASFAGVMKLHKMGSLKEGDVVVCTLTGHGLKDPEMAMSVAQKPITVQPNFEEVIKVLGY